MVADTLRDLRPERIGHGINAIRDMALVERIAEAGVVLEVCPAATCIWARCRPGRRIRSRG
jgi:adenosine deaminase